MMIETDSEIPPRVEDMLVGLVITRTLKLHGTALTLLYSAMDYMAYLSMPPTNADGTPKTGSTRTDFRAWVDRYILPNDEIPATSDDVYSARCGWVHEHNYTSRGTREQRTKGILYAWGHDNVYDLNATILLTNKADSFTAVNIDVLIDLFIAGVRRFFDDVRQSPDLGAKVRERMAGEVQHVVADGPFAMKVKPMFADELNVDSMIRALGAAHGLRSCLRRGTSTEGA
jgi:hypothetical protein